MKQKSLANPEVYKSKNKDYDEFAQAEDYPKKINKEILPYLRGKDVLDVGCGTGKFVKVLAPHSKSYIALDISEEQLKLAKINSRNIRKIKFINASAEKIPFPDNSFDFVFASWVVSVIKGRRRKKQALKEMRRVLRKKGKLFIIENDYIGEFERIRRHPIRTRRYNSWLEKQGFRVKKIRTYFKFKDFETAKRVIKSFYGDGISNKLKSKVIEHRVILFSN